METTMGRRLRAPGTWTAPSPSTTRICRMATCPAAGAASARARAARRNQINDTSPYRDSVGGEGDLSGFSNQDGGDVIRAAGALGGVDQPAATVFERSAVAAGLDQALHLGQIHHAVEPVA